MKELIYLIIAIGAAMVGYEIHHSAFIAVLCFFFWPIALIYWLVSKQINLTVITHTFSFLLK